MRMNTRCSSRNANDFVQPGSRRSTKSPSSKALSDVPLKRPERSTSLFNGGLNAALIEGQSATPAKATATAAALNETARLRVSMRLQISTAHILRACRPTKRQAPRCSGAVPDQPMAAKYQFFNVLLGSRAYRGPFTPGAPDVSDRWR